MPRPIAARIATPATIIQTIGRFFSDLLAELDDTFTTSLAGSPPDDSPPGGRQPLRYGTCSWLGCSYSAW
jgi:hypothetical protein